MKISVTREDIALDDGDPVAHALERALGGSWATGRFAAHNEKHEKVVLPPLAREWLAEYDFSRAGEPIEFEVAVEGEKQQ